MKKKKLSLNAFAENKLVNKQGLLIKGGVGENGGTIEFIDDDIIPPPPTPHLPEGHTGPPTGHSSSSPSSKPDGTVIRII